MIDRRFADLHLHTNRSDGSDAPARVVERAAAVGFAAIAVTDHDTTAAVEEAAACARAGGIELLPGVEISGSYGQIEVHVIGLGFDPRHPALAALFGAQQDARRRRLDKILARLNKLGISITEDDVLVQAQGAAVIGRMHVARAIHARGITKTVQEGFDRFIGRSGKAYVPKSNVSCRKAVDAIHEAGGLSFVGHPGVGGTVHKILARLLTLPFDGLEAYHIQHSPGQVTQFLQVAEERGLLVSGGSDCHGNANGSEPDMGKVRVPWRHYAAIKSALASRQAAGPH